MNLPHFDEKRIRDHASAQSFERGLDYYEGGSVYSLVWRGNELHAEVLGSHYDPYNVEIIFTESALTSAWCDCPYDWGGWCKHIVATLLAYLYQPEKIQKRPEAGELLATLSRERLERLLLHLIRENPALLADVEAWLARSDSEASP